MSSLLIKLLFIIVLFIVLFNNTMNIKEYVVDKQELIVEVKTKKGIEKVDLDDYLFGVVAGEMPLHFELEALKAQVVASRTFVLSRDLKVDNTTKTQVYLNEEEAKKKWGKQYDVYSKKIKKAIEETYNEVMMYEGSYISALFFASSNGMTNNCDDYFSGGKPYLKSVDSHWDKDVHPRFEREYKFSKDQLSSLLNISIDHIELNEYSNGYVNEVKVNQKVYSGREIRELLNLASSSFDIIEDNGMYTFITYGSGHGVGMSQYGAQAMALKKYNYKDILNHYYQNIDIVSIEL